MAEGEGAPSSSAESAAAALLRVPVEALRGVGGALVRVCVDPDGLAAVFRVRGVPCGVRVERGDRGGPAFRALAHLRVLYGPDALGDVLAPLADAAAAALGDETFEAIRSRAEVAAGVARVPAWLGWEHLAGAALPTFERPRGNDLADAQVAVDTSARDLPPPPMDAAPAAWLQWILGVDAATMERCRVTLDLTLRDEQAVVFEFRDARARRFTLRLDPPDAEAPAFLRLPEGNFSYGPDDAAEILRPMLDRARAVLPVRPFAAVRAAVSVAVAFRPGMDRSRIGNVRDGLHEAWRHPDRWRVFLADREIARGYDSALQFDLPFVRVEHGPDECQYAGLGDTIRYPWRGAAVRPDVDVRALVREKKVGSFVTDMDDMDVIHGARAKVDTILDLVNRELDPQLVVVNCTCVPTMTGDDVRGAVTDARRCSKYPVVYRDQTPNSFGPYITEVSKSLPTSRARPADPRAVNLIGFSPGPGRDEVVALLGAIGVRVNAQAVPALAPAEFARWLDAGTQVYLEDRAWDSLAQHLFAQAPLNLVQPPAPYGVRGARAFLVAVGRSVGVDDIEARVDAALADVAVRFDAATARARGLGLGFVVTAEELSRLADPPRFYGIPVASLLDEMGFALRVAVYAPDGVAPAFPWEVLTARPERHALTTFADAAGLDAFLRRPDVHAVYSDFGYDHRIAGAGKASFAADLFELGPARAVETLRRLVTLCRLPFFRDHGRHLARGAAERA